MDWSLLVLGMVLGSAITSGLIWFVRRSANNADPLNFSGIAQSVIVTAILAGVLRSVLDYIASGVLSANGILFGIGWMGGGLLAAYVLSGRTRNS